MRSGGRRERIRRKLARSADGDRQMVSTLTTVLSDGLPAMEAACQEALREDVRGRFANRGNQRADDTWTENRFR